MGASTIGRDVLDFLDEHRLDHTPDHYAFAHRYLFSADRTLRSGVAAAIEGGVRITPAQIEALSPGASPTPANDTLAPRLDRIVASVVEVIGAAVEEAGSLGRILTTAAADLLTSDERKLRAVVAAMIEETERAGAGLAETVRRTATLRDELKAFDAVSANGPRSASTGRAAVLDAIGEIARGSSEVGVMLVALREQDRIERDHGPGVCRRLLGAVFSTFQQHLPSGKVLMLDDHAIAVVAPGSREEMSTLVERALVTFAARRFRLREGDVPLGEVLLITSSASAAPSAGEALLVTARKGLVG